MARPARVAALLAVCLAPGAPDGASARTIAAVDLAASFAARSPWRFTAEQGADVADPIMEDGGTVPGAITLCIAKAGGRCEPDLMALLRNAEAGSEYTEPHYLEAARIEPPLGRAGQALLLVRAASLHAVNNSQAVATQVLAYDRAADAFRIAYAKVVGRNNNQEVRYVEQGPLAGLIVSAEPTGGAPFGYWITASRRTRPFAFTPILRYRSGTRYGDGNALAVIDSEATEIARRLGLWRAGMKPLLPPGGCAAPHLRGTVLWCARVAPGGASD